MFDNETTLGDYFGMIHPAKTAEESDSIITNDSIGVEIELEGIPEAKAPYRGLWTTHVDNSLRNGGVEFVFRRPLNGKDVIKALEQLDKSFDMLKEGTGQIPEKSVRSSVHVHVDCTDLTANQLIRFVLLYSIYELPLFRTFGNNRMGSHFCIPLRDCYDLLDVPRALNGGWELLHKEINHPNIERYCAFNVKSLFKFGTIEFRHHPGEWKANKLLPWINSCLSFKRAAMIDFNVKETYFLHSHQGYERQLRDVFPRDVAEMMLATYNHNSALFNLDVIQGIRIAQHQVSPKSYGESLFVA